VGLLCSLFGRPFPPARLSVAPRASRQRGSVEASVCSIQSLFMSPFEPKWARSASASAQAPFGHEGAPNPPEATQFI